LPACLPAVLLELPAPVSVLISGSMQQQQLQQLQQQPVSAAYTVEAAPSSSSSSTPATGKAPESSADPQDAEPKQPADQQPQQQQQFVLASRSVLVQLLQRCSDSSVRQQAFCAGLLPRLAEAAGLLDELARWVVLQ
jgi:hypothetical protein